MYGKIILSPGSAVFKVAELVQFKFPEIAFSGTQRAHKMGGEFLKDGSRGLGQKLLSHPGHFLGLHSHRDSPASCTELGSRAPRCLVCSSSSFKSAKKLETKQKNESGDLCRWMINCSEIAAMITELSSQVTLIRFFILLCTHMVLEQLPCKSAREAACKAPQLIITNQPALKTTHPIHGLLK